jgi:processive 1,2-diacylglycerol beta-glucosyltransferase
MEALVLSCGTGGGHNTAAQAVVEELTRRGHHATLLDPYTLVGDHVARRVGNAYIRLVQKSPRAFGVLYQLGNAYRRLPWRSPVFWVNRLLVDAMTAYLREHPVDILVASHLFPMEILAHMEGLPPTVFIATDYTCIPFTEETRCDRYCIPSPDLAAEYVGWGIDREKLRPYGIPVRAAFRADLSRAEARQQLGLAADKTYLLLAGGSIGAGSIRHAITALEPYLQEHPDTALLVLCGSNEKLYDHLTARYGGHGQVQLLQSTPHMAAYLRACDVFITKPGGLSSTEGAASGIPMVLISPIPGCESRNAAFFAQRGMAIPVRRLRRDLLPAIASALDPATAAKMQENQAQYVDKHGVEHLCDDLETMI